MPRMTDAKRAVNEQFGFDLGFPQKADKVLFRDFPRRDHAGKAERLQLFRHGAVMPRHLRTCVELQRRDCPSDRHCTADVGNDQRVNARFRRVPSRVEKLLQLAVGYQRVERQINLYAVGVRFPHRFAQSFGRKIAGMDPSVHRNAAEINGVRPAFDSGVQRRHGSCRAKQLGFLDRFFHRQISLNVSRSNMVPTRRLFAAFMLFSSVSRTAVASLSALTDGSSGAGVSTGAVSNSRPSKESC